MNWSERVEAMFRVFARQHADTSVDFDDMRSSLLSLVPETEFGKVTEYYLPVAAEDIERSRAQGLLLTEFDGRVCYVIRQLPITIPRGLEFCDTLLHELPGKFASVRYVREALTEIVAI